MPIVNFFSRPQSWVFLFVLLSQLVFALPELIILGMALFGLLLHRDNQKLRGTLFSTDEERALWLVPLGFTSVFWIKLISASWAFNAEQAISSAFNSIHFLLWPLLVIFFQRANITIRQTEIWAATSLIVLLVWYLGVRLFFPMSEDAQCFKAGAHNCGLLGQILAFILLWMFISFTRQTHDKLNKFYLLIALFAGWIAFLGTMRRTELVGLLIGMCIVLIWRFKKNISLRSIFSFLGLCLILMTLAWSVMKPRFSVVNDEISFFFQNTASRTEAINTSVGARLEMYRIAYLAIQERPLLGWGAGLKPKHIPQFATDPKNPFGYSNFHQQYLQIILEVGLLGAGVGLIFLIYLCKRMILIPLQNDSRESAAIIAALFFTYAWKGLANGSMQYSVTNTIFVFFSALIWAEFIKHDAKKPLRVNKGES